MIAHRISTAVLERLGDRTMMGTVVAASARAVHADVAGFVVSLTGPRSPLMPNGIALTAPLPDPPPAAPGDRVRIGPGFLRGPGVVVCWDTAAPALWDPRVAAWDVACAPEVARRAAALAAWSRGVPGPAPRPGAVALLLRAVDDRRPESAAAAAAALAGSGPGLTPVGDDLLAGAAVTVAALGEACGFDGPRRRAWLRALRPPDLRARTTAVAATLLDLAVAGRAAEPLHAVLGDPPAHARAAAAAGRLRAVGSSTGPAYAFAVAACARRLAVQPDKEHR